MGWCSATEIFDCTVEGWLDAIKYFPYKQGKQRDAFIARAKKAIKAVIEKLEGDDWDCQSDSGYYDDPFINEIFMELHPNWEVDI